MNDEDKNTEIDEEDQIDEDRRYEVDEIASNSEGKPSTIIPKAYWDDFTNRFKETFKAARELYKDSLIPFKKRVK